MVGASAGGVTLTGMLVTALVPPVTLTVYLEGVSVPRGMMGTVNRILEVLVAVAAAGDCTREVKVFGSVQAKAPVPAERLALRVALVLPAVADGRQASVVWY